MVRHEEDGLDPEEPTDLPPKKYDTKSFLFGDMDDLDDDEDDDEYEEEDSDEDDDESDEEDEDEEDDQKYGSPGRRGQ
jgi:hypothetical protein